MYNLVQRSKEMKNKKGFTLIELIVVIVILGILAAIAIPRLGAFTESGKQAADKEAAAVVANAAAMYYANNINTVDAMATPDITIANLTGTNPPLVTNADLALKSNLYGPRTIGDGDISLASGVVTVTIGTGTNAYSVSK